MSIKTRLEGGPNIAMKVPPHLWEETVRFYRDLLGLEVLDEASIPTQSICFRFGGNRLWIDRVEALSQAEIWLEMTTSDLPAAAGELRAAGIVRRDEIEPLPEGMKGFWIQNPASIIHLVTEPEAEPEDK